ncbi:MAG TPA: hypothetical protein VGJ75_20130, partial [Dongiaceae bacterium]
MQCKKSVSRNFGEQFCVQTPIEGCDAVRRNLRGSRNRNMSAARGWLSVSGGIHCAEVATAQPASPDRPSLEAVLHHLGERRTCVQLLFRHACNDRISILDALLVDDPRSQPVAGKPRGDAIGDRVDIVSDQHVHDDAAAGRQPRADGVAGLDVEFIVKAKIRT